MHASTVNVWFSVFWDRGTADDELVVGLLLDHGGSGHVGGHVTGAVQTTAVVQVVLNVLDVSLDTVGH
jgi:hypothetical protein